HRNESGRRRRARRRALRRPGGRNRPKRCWVRCETSWPRGVYNAVVAQEKLYTIAVDAATQYLADQSDEAGGRYVFAYTITISNTGTGPAQLMSRHWGITA